MSAWCLRVVVRLVQGWTRLYTSGMKPELRDRRRAEIASDLWESSRQPQTARLAVHLLFRFLLGIGDDLRWRSACRTRSTIAQGAAIAAVAATMFAVALVLTLTRVSALPTPPPLAHHVREVATPPPPPPPPPPCAPPGSGHTSPSPCVR